jgi:phosphoglycolate phosphatase
LNPALVLFDLDGTLVDSAPDIARALAAALAEAGVPPPPLEAVKRMVGDGARQLVRRALAAAQLSDDAREEAMFARFLTLYRENLCVDSRLYPGVAAGLTSLRSTGAALAVVTNKPGDMARALLGSLGVAASLEAIIGDGDGFPRKPDPAAALSVLARVGASPAGTVVVGDGLPDMRLGRALGALTLAAAWGYVPADDLRGEGPALVADSFEAAVSAIRAAT